MTAAFRSEVFEYANTVVEWMAATDPMFATGAGVPGYDALLPDFSSDSQRRVGEELMNHLIAIDGLQPTDAIDRVARQVLLERLGARMALQSFHELERSISVINSPLAEIRQVFEMMSTSSAEDAQVLAARLHAVRGSLKSWRNSLRNVAVAGQLPAVRHLQGIADQAATYGEGAFTELAERAATSCFVDVEASGLRAAGEDADAACRELSAWFVTELLPRAGTKEGCGAQRYQLWASYWTGTTPDLDELYAWGYADLQRIRSRMLEIAAELTPAASSLVETAEYLDADPARRIVGVDALLAKLKSFTAQAVLALDGTHFDIDPRIRFCDARIAPDGSAAAPYYIGPSEDLSRPGTTWFPTLGETTFSWWRHASTWYHEGVPGHHLQDGTAILLGDSLSRFHRLAGWTSGYGEGWALYAERLMDELGFFSDLGDELGYLSNQALRAARIVVDLGLHLELAAPEDLGTLGDLGDCSGKTWTPEMAVALLEEWAIQDHETSVSEVDRYLGWPAQAISYKVGERVWLEARAEAQARLGDAFSLKSFHAYALRLGPLGLDTFAEELRNWDGRP